MNECCFFFFSKTDLFDFSPFLLHKIPTIHIVRQRNTKKTCPEVLWENCWVHSLYQQLLRQPAIILSAKKHLIKSSHFPSTAWSIHNLFIHLSVSLLGNHSWSLLSSHPHTFNSPPLFVHSPYPSEAGCRIHNQSELSINIRVFTDQSQLPDPPTPLYFSILLYLPSTYASPFVLFFFQLLHLFFPLLFHLLTFVELPPSIGELF